VNWLVRQTDEVDARQNFAQRSVSPIFVMYLFSLAEKSMSFGLPEVITSARHCKSESRAGTKKEVSERRHAMES